MKLQAALLCALLAVQTSALTSNDFHWSPWRTYTTPATTKHVTTPIKTTAKVTTKVVPTTTKKTSTSCTTTTKKKTTTSCTTTKKSPSTMSTVKTTPSTTKATTTPVITTPVITTPATTPATTETTSATTTTSSSAVPPTCLKDYVDCDPLLPNLCCGACVLTSETTGVCYTRTCKLVGSACDPTSGIYPNSQCCSLVCNPDVNSSTGGTCVPFD